MNGAEGLVRGVGKLEDGGSVRHVDGVGEHPRPVRGEFVRRLVQGLLLDVRENDPQALGREPPRHGEPDAARRARDDGDLSLSQPHQALPAGGASRICCGSS